MGYRIAPSKEDAAKGGRNSKRGPNKPKIKDWDVFATLMGTEFTNAAINSLRDIKRNGTAKEYLTAYHRFLSYFKPMLKSIELQATVEQSINFITHMGDDEYEEFDNMDDSAYHIV